MSYNPAFVADDLSNNEQARAGLSSSDAGSTSASGAGGVQLTSFKTLEQPVERPSGQQSYHTVLNISPSSVASNAKRLTSPHHKEYNLMQEKNVKHKDDNAKKTSNSKKASNGSSSGVANASGPNMKPNVKDKITQNNNANNSNSNSINMEPVANNTNTNSSMSLISDSQTQASASINYDSNSCINDETDETILTTTTNTSTTSEPSPLTSSASSLASSTSSTSSKADGLLHTNKGDMNVSKKNNSTPSSTTGSLDLSMGGLLAAVECRDMRYDVGRGKNQKTILHNINVTVPEGSIYGLLGPSGCGKTTMLRCVVGRIKPKSGSVRVFGCRPNQPGSQIPGPAIGYMPQEISVYEDFTINETLIYFGKINNMKQELIKARIDFLLSFLDLPGKNRLIGSLSANQEEIVSQVRRLIGSKKGISRGRSKSLTLPSKSSMVSLVN